MASVKQSWINKYGIDKGLQMWEDRKRLSACSLESFIKKYGVDEGNLKFSSWKSNLKKSKTLIGYIEKYGEVVGTQKYLQKNKKLSVSVESLKKNGKTDEEILQIRKTHANKSKITLETMISKYGFDTGTEKWQLRINKAKISSKRSLDYWISICNGNVSLAKEKLCEYQRRDKNFYIKKYGEVVGVQRYQLAKEKRFLGGYKEPVSKFQKEVEDYIKSLQIFFHGHENCYCFFLNGELNQSVLIPDILIPDKNIIIECFGDYWHCSEKKYNDDFFHEVIKKSAKEIRSNDQKRIDFLKNKGYNVIIVWENEWRIDRNNQMEIISNEINKKRN